MEREKPPAQRFQERADVPVDESGAPRPLDAASALANPSRRRIAEVLAGAPEGMSVAEIAERVDLHYNSVRQHLRHLARSGVVASARDEPHGRGRPTERYWLIDDRAPQLAAHDELVRLLVGLIVRAEVEGEEIEAFGRDSGRNLAMGIDSEGIVPALARLGFAPRTTTSAAGKESGSLDVVLEYCPFREAVLAPGGEAICRLHGGLMAGMASCVCPTAELTRFEPKDPRVAGCRVTIEGLVP